MKLFNRPRKYVFKPKTIMEIRIGDTAVTERTVYLFSSSPVNVIVRYIIIKCRNDKVRVMNVAGARRGNAHYLNIKDIKIERTIYETIE